MTTNKQKEERLRFAYCLDNAFGTWKELFDEMYNPEIISFETEKLKQKILNGKYAESTYRRFCYMLYWFIYYAMPNYHYEKFEFQEYWLSGARCKINDDYYIVSFGTKDGMPVPKELSKQFNPKKQTFEEFIEHERKYRVHYIEPLY